MTQPPNQRPIEAGITTDLTDRLTYGGYLRLDLLLAAQQPISKPVHHDELLFIVQHQVAELWMKLVIHELRAAIAHLQADRLAPTQKILARVKMVQRQLFEQWGVLETLTPNEYLEFRHLLGPASGFQSLQYRLIEFLLGNRNHAMLKPHAHDVETTNLLEAELATPSLYDEVLRLADRNGLKMPAAVLARDVRETHSFNEGVLQAWRVVYEAPETHWMLYELAEKLVDFEDYFRRWRFNHVTTVERVIGFKRGTGGTGGVSYLRKMLDVVLFPEIWSLRTSL